MSTLSIGTLAQRAGVGIDTVRYYERQGLLAPAGRLDSGYRRYGTDELRRLRFIRRAKALGFSLEDIRGLLALSATRHVGEVKQAAQMRLADLQQRIADLQRVERGLRELVDACPGHGDSADCPILRALSEEIPAP